VGYHEEFLSKEVPVVQWLFLFNGGEVLEAGFLSEGFLGSFWTTGLTGLLNQSNWFPLPV
jgi:hypothetical protein